MEAVLAGDSFWNEFAAYGDGVCEELGQETIMLLKSLLDQNFGLKVDNPIRGNAQSKVLQTGLERLVKYEIIAPVIGHKDDYILTVPLLGIWLKRQPK